MKFGMIGTNFVTDTFLDAVHSVDGVEAPYIFSRSVERGEAFVNKYHLKKAYTDLSEFLSNPEIDAVYIASPNAIHYSQALEAFQYGKHVLCEKTVVSNQKEFQSVKKAALNNKKVFMEAMRSIHDPALSLLKEQLTKIGPIRRARMEFCQYSSRYDSFKSGIIPNVFNPDLSNAAVMDIGIYPMEVMIYLFGKPSSITSKSMFLSGGFEGGGVALMEYEGMIGEVVYSKIVNSYLPCEIQGEKGNILIEQMVNPTNITIIYRNGERENVLHQDVQNNMKYEIETFKRLVENECYEHDFYDISDTALAVIDEIRRQNHIVFPADK